MAEPLAPMTARTERFQQRSVPEEDIFGLAPAVRAKVEAGTGAWRPFYGSTVAYFLEPAARHLVDRVTDNLYAYCGDSLSARLPAESYHVTLHDLRSAEKLDDVASAVFLDTRRTGSMISTAHNVGDVRLLCTSVFNLMNTSVAVGLVPVSDDDCERLHVARGIFDEIVPSGHFTPHITLAYYRPDATVPLTPALLSQTLETLTESVVGQTVTLTPALLRALHFSSMATYWDAGGA